MSGAEVAVDHSFSRGTAVPSNWRLRRLRHVVQINPSDNGWRSLPLDSVVTFLPMERLGEYGQIDVRLTKELAEVTSGFTPFREADVLVAKITPCFENGKGARAVGLMNGIGFGTTELHVLRPTAHMLPRFLEYVSYSSPFRRLGVAAMKGVAGQKRVDGDFLRDYVVAVPPVEEQRLIADFLDRETERIDSLLGKNRRLVELLEERRLSLVSAAVTKGLDANVLLKDSGVEWLGHVPAHWHVGKIKHVSPVLRGASPRPIDDPVYFEEDGEYAWVRISDVTAARGRLVKTHQRLSALGSSRSVKLDPGSLFVSIAATVGKPCITQIKCCIHDGFVYFPLARSWQEFLYWVFESRQAFLGLGKLGTQVNLNTDTVGDVCVALPPEDEVAPVIRHLEHETAQLAVLQEAVEAALAQLQEYRLSLITAAVTGQIDVRTFRPREPEEVAAANDSKESSTTSWTSAEVLA